MKSLITGICGFAGSHLAELLLDDGNEVFGISYPGESCSNITGILDRVGVSEADVTDRETVVKVIRDLRPDVIYHLAGMASVGRSWTDTNETLRVNAVGLVNLVLAGREAGDPVILVVGSGEMYGLVDENRQPIKEETPLRPISPYALSKVWQEQAGYYFTSVYSYPLVMVRPFNHTGPRQSPMFVCSDFARQLAEIESGRSEPVIGVGNLEARRDFLDVRDVAAAYRLAVYQGRRGVPYNIASGKPHSIRHILEILIELCSVQVEIREEEDRMRPVDILLLTGDSGRIMEETGWSPSFPLEETLKDLLDYWRGKTDEGKNKLC